MNSINLFTLTTTQKLGNDIASRKSVIEEKLASKYREYNRLAEMKEATSITEFKVRMSQALTALNEEIDELKEVLASFYKNIH